MGCRTFALAAGSALAVLVCALSVTASAQSAKSNTAQRRDAFVQSRLHPAIGYGKVPEDNALARLERRLESGETKLAFDPDNGYLKAVLEALQIPVESQSLVFSQTSLQGEKINVKNPRAIYFNDTSSVGWVRGERLLELAAQDTRQGVVFYTLDQERSARPRLTRQEECLACHLSWENFGVPGLMIQSVNPLPDQYSYVVGFTTNHASPYPQRYGGWYVTGPHGKVKHMGNLPVMPEDKGKLPLPDRREIASVDGLFDPRGYLSKFSDVVALTVLAHQATMTNHITRVGWEARVADASPSADASARVVEAARDLVDYLLFVDEALFEHPMQSTSGFAAKFSAQGPRDHLGRSLHDLDLQHRLLKYPCSYMIYSPGFDALPATAKKAVYERLWAILSGKETGRPYARLTAADREAVLQILRDTKKDLPDYFSRT